jgi:hypothetical protein
MYFKFDLCLNPQSVYGVMLRLKQASWLDSFEVIVVQDHDDMWEIRKRFPKVAGRVHDIYDQGSDWETSVPARWLYVEREDARYYSYEDATEWFEIDPEVTLKLEDLAPVATITSDYT